MLEITRGTKQAMASQTSKSWKSRSSMMVSLHKTSKMKFLKKLAPFPLTIQKVLFQLMKLLYS